jgi:hypothetical protein
MQQINFTQNIEKNECFDLSLIERKYIKVAELLVTTLNLIAESIDSKVSNNGDLRGFNKI